MNLIAALRHAALPLSAEDLRRRVGNGAYPDDKAAFRRAFERDKDLLRSLGIPLEMAPIPFTDPPTDGYRIDKRKYEAKLFEPDELKALQLASSLVRLEGSDEGLARLGAPGEPESEALGRVGYHEANDVLIPAAADRRAVAFSYNGARRTVEPWVVGFSGGNWYMAGFDRLRKAERTFRVDRIEGTVSAAGKALHEVGELHEPFAFRPWEFPESPPVQALVAVDAEREASARSLFRLGTGCLDTASDGRLLVNLQVRNPAGLRYALLDLGDSAELLAPEDLRLDMIAWLEALL